MDMNMHSGVLAFLLDDPECSCTARFGYVDQLEAICQVMVSNDQNTEVINRVIASGYNHMGRIHRKVQGRIR